MENGTGILHVVGHWPKWYQYDLCLWSFSNSGSISYKWPVKSLIYRRIASCCCVCKHVSMLIDGNAELQRTAITQICIYMYVEMYICTWMNDVKFMTGVKAAIAERSETRPMKSVVLDYPPYPGNRINPLCCPTFAGNQILILFTWFIYTQSQCPGSALL